MVLVLWWNMDPVNPNGTIAPYSSPNDVSKPVSSSAYVDDARRIIALAIHLHTCQESFEKVQGYCNLLADLSLVIKMGRNVNKCALWLYNIPQNVSIPKFTSTAWSYDAQGPTIRIIATTVIRRNNEGQLICYDVPKDVQKDVDQHIKDILSPSKYLGITSNAQLDQTVGTE